MTAPAGGSRADRPVLPPYPGACPDCGRDLIEREDDLLCRECGYREATVSEWEISKLLSTPTYQPLVLRGGQRRPPEDIAKDGRVLRDLILLAAGAAALLVGLLCGGVL